MPRWIRLAALLFAAVAAVAWWVPQQPPDEPRAEVAGVQHDPAFLPPEAITTLERIERGGPFPHDRDDTTFQNRERRLPERPRGYYREFTVETPGARDPGRRRGGLGGARRAVPRFRRRLSGNALSDSGCRSRACPRSAPPRAVPR